MMDCSRSLKKNLDSKQKSSCDRYAIQQALSVLTHHFQPQAWPAHIQHRKQILHTSLEHFEH